MCHEHCPFAHTHPSNMTFISDDPSYWPHIGFNVFLSYWTVAAVVVMVYDWVLTLGREIEHIWRKRWSLITVLYLIIRYIGIPYSIIYAIGVADRHSAITDYSVNGSIVILTDMLGVIVAIALHETVMGHGSLGTPEELILSGMHTCDYGIGSDERLLISMAWGLNTVWEVLALCLSVWVAVKHFRDLRQLAPSTGSTMGDWFRVLIQSHALYFASFVGVSCLHLAALSPEIAKSDLGVSILGSALQIFMVIQMFVLGPRLILSIREHHAKLVAYSDTETTMNSIVFQEDVHASTSSTV
ncbi:hypothetical protein EV424DRAFT_1556708 [Suillus variegatus]|nr:hypothetical protein EV424DRAFT_1556708 [Suillus variegatus]